MTIPSRTKVCVVGNGPSAQGKAAEIDACDFVVRIKAFWTHGAIDAGEKIDALAWFGGWGGWQDRPELHCEHWFTHCQLQLEAAGGTGQQRLEHFTRQARLATVRWYTNDMWLAAREFLHRHPSTGFVAVQMALEQFPDCELVLYGFDSTHPQLPHFTDARADMIDPAHDVLAEKHAFAKLETGYWMGCPSNVTLAWPHRPNLKAATEFVNKLAMQESDGGKGIQSDRDAAAKPRA